jgi:hypothetical protein
MEGIEKPHADKYKEITNEWNYDAGCTLTGLGLRTFQALGFCCRVYTQAHNCMFKNFRVELIPRAIGNVYRNMQIVVFEREYLIVACL